MSSLLSKSSGKTIFAGILIIITGALAKAFKCPYDNGILIVGVVLAAIGGILYFSDNSTRTDTGT